MRTRHNFVGESVFYSENRYQSVSFIDASMHRCIATLFTRFASRCSLQKKLRHCVIKINSQRQRLGATEPKIDLVENGALCHMARQSDYYDIGQ